MRIQFVCTVLAALFTCLPAWIAVAETQAEDDGFTRVVASQNLTVQRGDEKATKNKGIHPKKINRKEKHRLDRIAMIRFDNPDLGKAVRVAGLRLKPVNFGDHKNKPMRFRVYGVRDGDQQDEKFTSKDYDPNAEDTLVDRRYPTIIDRRQVAMLGSFSTERDEIVLFSNRQFLAFVRADTNQTVSFVIVRETDSGLNSTFAPVGSDDAPTLLLKFDEKQAEQPEAEQPEVEEEVEEEATAQDAQE